MPDYGDYYNDFEEIEDYAIDNEYYNEERTKDLYELFEGGE